MEPLIGGLIEKDIKLSKQTSKNRVALTQESIKRLQLWESQVSARYKGMNLKYSELVDWLVLNHSAELNPSELKDIQSKYWDDIAMASWALKELKRAKASGESLSLPEVFGQKPARGTKPPARTKRKTKSENSANNFNNLEKEELDSKAEV